jgi:hypothetical protein
MQVFRYVMVVACLVSPAVWADGKFKQVMVGSTLQSGFDMGVNSSEGKTDWVTNMDGYFSLAYPNDQAWGALFITVGKPRNPPRPFMDLSSYKTLKLEMKGQNGGELVSIGVKTNTQPDDGTETKMPLRVSKDWETYQFDLVSFERADPKRLYIVTEVVFDGVVGKTVMLQNISFSD